MGCITGKPLHQSPNQSMKKIAATHIINGIKKGQPWH